MCLTGVWLRQLHSCRCAQTGIFICAIQLIACAPQHKVCAGLGCWCWMGILPDTQARQPTAALRQLVRADECTLECSAVA